MFKFSKNKLNYIWYLITIFFVMNLIIFVISSFYDIEISNYLTILMQYKLVKVWTVFSEAVGSVIPLWVAFVAITIMLETILLHKNNIIANNKVAAFLLNNMFILIIIYYILITISANLYFGFMYISSPTSDFGFGIGFDVKAMTSYNIRVTCTWVFAILSNIILLMSFIYFRVNKFKKQFIFKNKLWLGSIKISIFFVLSYSMIFIVKHFFGRPYYFSYILLDRPGIPISIQEIIRRHPEWNITMEQIIQNQQWVSTEFFSWWQPNNILQNLKYWFNPPPFNNPNKDMWWNMDFPSGHVTATTILASTLFLVPKNMNKIRNFYASLMCLFVILMEVSMVVYRFHWTTDVAFSGFVGVLFYWLTNYIFNRNKYKFLSKSNKLFNKVINKGIFIHENGILKFTLYFNDELKKIIYNKTKNKDKTIKKLAKKYHLSKYEVLESQPLNEGDELYGIFT